MVVGAVTTGRSETVASAAKLMREENIGMLVVAGNGKTHEGVVTDRDLIVRLWAKATTPETAQSPST